MKKTFRKSAKALAVLASALVLFNFMSCASDDDDDESQPVASRIVMNGKAYESIKDALAAIPTSGDTGTYTISLLPGTYNENYINYNGSATVKISGNTPTKYGADVIITGHGTNMGQERGRELVEFQGSGNLILENLTLLSDYSRKDVAGDAQAEVLGYDGTGYIAAYNCSFKSHQDTMRTTGKGWFYKCYVEGDTDFIWMESSGIVALYEECEIVSVYDEYASTHASYILAPRATVANAIGKGAVIFNSTVKLQNNSNFLFRNPWGKNADYYNQGAFVGCTFETAEGKTFEPALAKSEAMGTDDQQYVGWKIDSTAYTNKLASIGIISDTVKANEYSGRRAILNRNYIVKNEAFGKDAESYWPVDSFIKTNNWTVTEDTSKELLEGETEPTVTVYDLTTETVPTGLTCTGFAHELGKTHYVGQNGSTISFDVTGKCTVAVTGYYQGTGTIQAGEQGAAYYNVANGSTSKFITKEYTVYTDGKSTVTITAAGTSYLTKIAVTYDAAITYKPVTSITVSAADKATSISGKKTLQFSAVVAPENASNTDFDWSVSDEAAATIDANGLLTAANVENETTVTVTATAKDPASAKGEFLLTIVPASANAVEFVWLDNTNADFTGTSSNTEIATAGTAEVPATDADGNTGTWSYNSSKMAGSCKTGVTLSTSDANPKKGEWYVEYPVTAAVNMRLNSLKIYWGNAGTSNLRTYVTYIDNAGTESVIFDDMASKENSSPRNSDNDSLEFTLSKILAAGETGKVRVCIHGYRIVNNEDGSTTESVQSFSGKAPSWGKTIISAEAGFFPV